MVQVMSDIITEVDKYITGWTGGLPETPCGFGSKMKATQAQREWMPMIVEKYEISTVSDIGAGDLNWINSVDWDVDYTPYDLVPRLPEVIEFDVVKQIPEGCDLILCLWVLNHLPFEHCQAAIRNIKASGSEYLMMTDRLRYREDQPPEIEMKYIEKMSLNDLGDSIMLIKL